jgi:asparagine synthase (glutamine-hydrolysing)
MAFLSRRARPGLRDLPRLGYFALPLPLRRTVAGRRMWRPPWLTPEGVRLLRRAIAADAAEPRSFAARVAWLGRRRYLALARRSYDIVGAEWGTRIEHPLLEPGFLAAVAQEGGRSGFGDRTTAMRQMFGHLLPDELLARPTKAVFGDAFYRAPTKEFLRTHDGPPPFPDLVVQDGLRSAWGQGDVRTPRLLLQATWLASSR